MNYKILAIIGQAGSGKDTLMKKVLAINDNLHEIVSFTTRPPREGEVDGVNYHFIDGEEFGAKVVRALPFPYISVGIIIPSVTSSVCGVC